MTLPPDHSPETPVVSMIRSGFEQIIERSRATLRHAARARGLHASEADELVQELRVKLWKVAGNDGESAKRLTPSYVYRAAMTAAVDIIRRRQSARVSQLDGSSVALQSPIRADASADQSDLASALHTSPEAMVASRATVVRLHLAGYDREEIAQLTGWSEPKTRNLLYRGLDDLRAALEQRGYAP